MTMLQGAGGDPVRRESCEVPVRDGDVRHGPQHGMDLVGVSDQNASWSV
jgi:hypothetical protein